MNVLKFFLPNSACKYLNREAWIPSSSLSNPFGNLEFNLNFSVIIAWRNHVGAKNGLSIYHYWLAICWKLKKQEEAKQFYFTYLFTVLQKIWFFHNFFMNIKKQLAKMCPQK